MIEVIKAGLINIIGRIGYQLALAKGLVCFYVCSLPQKAANATTLVEVKLTEIQGENMKRALEWVRSKIDVKILKNVFWLSGDKVFRLLLSLVAGAWVARYLGPYEWGKLNYVLAFISIIVTVTTLGMDGFLVKELVENKAEKNKILGTSLVLRFVSVMAMLVVMLVVFFLLRSSVETYRIFLLLFFTVALTPFDLIDLEYQSKLQSKKTVISKNTGYVLGAFLKVGAILLKLKLIFFAAILGLESVLAYGLLVLQYQKANGSVFNWGFDKTLVAHFIKSGWPFFLSGLAVILYMRLDQIMLGKSLSPNAVGQFSSAVKVSEMFLFIPAAVAGSFYPSLVEAKKSLGAVAYYLKVRQLIKFMLAISFFICIAVTLFSPLIIKILFGSKYSSAAVILQIHIWSLMAIFFGVAFSQYLVIENLQKYNFYRTVLGLLLNVALNIFLIPRFGGAGAAMATLASQYVSSIFGNFFFSKTRHSLQLLTVV